MPDRTRIPWADATWNPMTGCSPVSEACEHCYAKRMAGRNLPVTQCPMCDGKGRTPSFPKCPTCDGTGNVGFTPTFQGHRRVGKKHHDVIDIPLHWKKPRRIFVNSMSDLFHESFTDEQRCRVLDIVRMCPQHDFLVLTKRADEMRRFVRWEIDAACEGRAMNGQGPVGPLRNLFLGVTVENQARAEERIPILLDTPAVVRFVSVEPMLGAADLVQWLYPWHVETSCCGYEDVPYFDKTYALAHAFRESYTSGPGVNEHGYQAGPYEAGHKRSAIVSEHSSLDWVILGGETGPGARPMQPEWALDVFNQCRAAGVPFFFKAPGTATCWHSPFPGDLITMTETRQYPEVGG